MGSLTKTVSFNANQPKYGQDSATVSVGETVTAFQFFAISRNDVGSLTMASNSSLVANSSQPIFTGTVNISITEGVAGSYDFSQNFLNNVDSYAIAGSLPSGFSFNTVSGLLSWTTSVVAGTTTGFTVTATNLGGSDVTPAFSIVVNQPVPTGTVLLQSGYFTESNTAPQLIFPRPDSETPTWAKHRQHTSEHAYEIPIGVAFGNGPFFYELITGPSGATVGGFPAVSGDIYDWRNDENYGVVRWAAPTVGTHSFTVRVYFQGTPGATVGCPSPGYIDVSWTLEVRDDRTIYVDANAFAGGDGSINSPFQTVRDWYIANGDTTYSGYQVCYRGGTHIGAMDQAVTGVPNGHWPMNSDDKPMVHYGYPGESVTFDMDDTIIQFDSPGMGTTVGSHPDGSDFCWMNITTTGGKTNPSTDSVGIFVAYSAADGPTPYNAANAGGARMLWHRCSFTNFNPLSTQSGTNINGCIFWHANGNPNRSFYGYTSRITFDSVGNGHPNCNGFYLSNPDYWLAEHITCINTNFGRGATISKSDNHGICTRFLDASQASDFNLQVQVAGSYNFNGGGPVEFSYQILNNSAQTTNISDTVTYNGGNENYSSSNPGHYPIHVMRSVLSRAPSTSNAGVHRVLSNWPVHISDNITVGNVDFRAGAATVNTTIHYNVANNPFDANYSLTGSDRTTYLGLKGHEIATAGAI